MLKSIARVEMLESRCLLSAVVAAAPVGGGISGLVYDDHNASGTQDPGDQGLGGVKVFLDLKHTGIFAQGDPFATTSPQGDYAFSNLTPGTYSVTTQPPAGFQQDYPFGGQEYSIAVASGKTTIGINFGETTSSHVSGTVYSNATGKLVGLAGVTVTITATNGSAPVFTKVTDSIGYYGIGGLPNTSYTVTLQLPAGYVLASGGLSQTTPVLGSGQNDNAVNFTLAPALAIVSSNRYVQVEAGTGSGEQTASGTAPFDGAVSGSQDSNVPGGYVNLTGTATQESTLTPTEFADSGPTHSEPYAVYALEEDDLVNGANAFAQAESYFQVTFTVKAAESYALSKSLTGFGPFDATFSFTGPGGVQVVPTQTGPNDMPVYQDGTLQPGTYTLTYDLLCYDNDDNLPNVPNYNLDLTFTPLPTTGSISGVVYDDHNGSGTQDAGDQGLSGVKVYIDANHTGVYAANDPTTLTNAQGNYTFAGLAPGAYSINTVPPAGFQQDFPFGGQEQHAAVVAATAASGYNFGETTSSHVSGTVYSNATGKLVGLSGVTVTIAAADGKGPVFTRTTDSVGYYGIAGLPNSSYIVTLQLPSGYVSAGGSLSQTTPVLASGQNDNAVNFTLTPAVVIDSSNRFVQVEDSVNLGAGFPASTQTATGTNAFNGSVSGEYAYGMESNYVNVSAGANQKSTLTSTEFTDQSPAPNYFGAVYAYEQDTLENGNDSSQGESYFQVTFTVKSAITYSLNASAGGAGGAMALFSFTGPGGVAVAPAQDLANTNNPVIQSGTLKPGTYIITFDCICTDSYDDEPMIPQYALDLKFGV